MTTCTSKLRYDVTGNIMLKFSISDKNRMSAQHFKKDKDGDYQESDCESTDEIIIQTENWDALCRGVHQKSFCVNSLSRNQQEDILDSIDRRTIDIIYMGIYNNRFNRLKIIIYAFSPTILRQLHKEKIMVE